MPVSHSLYNEAGSVAIDYSACTRCGECSRICPTEVLRQEDGVVQVHTESMFGCIACGHCMMVCPAECVRVTGRGISAADLVPLAPPEERADRKALAALMQARRSVRRFREEEPPAELLQQIVAMAASGPMGIPPWDVGCAVIAGRERVQVLAGEVVNGYSGMLRILKPWVLAVMRPIMKRPAFEQMSGFIVPLVKAYIEGRSQGRNLLFYDAPAVLLFHHSPYVDASEAMIACTYAMLAVESMGLGTTMIGAAAPIIRRNQKLCQRLGIPAGNKPAIALIVGYPAVQFRRGVVRHFSSVSSFG
ncbi:electron transport complex subunit RsxC [Geobacter sp. OR-1]|uniref:nitroreductase family protein n=1 Tax=Geobacter sp. OR-1 TaxID=1266765 RepID=UPI00054341DB|nr:nitroreductase family protein [Geobacter sp. OR-1]GAM11785.1 electron transport complex subunit RsxC [Geobacter sp. OR-1]